GAGGAGHGRRGRAAVPRRGAGTAPRNGSAGPGGARPRRSGYVSGDSPVRGLGVGHYGCWNEAAVFRGAGTAGRGRGRTGTGEGGVRGGQRGRGGGGGGGRGALVGARRWGRRWEWRRRAGGDLARRCAPGRRGSGTPNGLDAGGGAGVRRACRAVAGDLLRPDAGGPPRWLTERPCGLLADGTAPQPLAPHPSPPR